MVGTTLHPQGGFKEGVGSPTRRRLHGQSPSRPESPQARSRSRRRFGSAFDEEQDPFQEEGHAQAGAADFSQAASAFALPPASVAEGEAETIEETEEANDEKAPESLSVLDQAYTELSEVPLSKDEVAEGLGIDCWEWMMKLQGALQLPWETILFGIISIITFGLANVTAQYTSMLSVPPLPFLGVAGRPGEAKSVLIWFIKSVIMEVQRRDNHEDVLDPEEPEPEVEETHASAVEGEAAPGIKTEGDKQHGAARKKPPNRYLVDMGTLYGYLLCASKNNGRAFAALHEAKTLLAKVVAEAPGFDPQALNKIYDRDEISNTVMGSASRFHMDHPWVVFFLVLHLEELKVIFGDGKDTCNILARFDLFHTESLVPNL